MADRIDGVVLQQPKFPKSNAPPPISCRPNFTKFEHNNVDQCCDKNFRNRILKILL